jgi:S-formylglutathione hydrolase FrmB
MTSRRSIRALCALLLSAAAVAAGSATAAPAHLRIRFHDTHDVHIVAAKQLDPRQWDVHVLSPALGRAVDVRILLPVGYNPRAARRYPVLYLFHGTSGGASDWVTQGGAETTTERLPLITVMPDAGFDFDGGGWFTDWVDRTTALGPSQWETFHIRDLVPWVDANLHTVRGRQGRAIAGLSQGGFGSTTYAARHPDLFSSVASFSGAPEIARDPEVAVGATAVIEATAYGLDGVQPEAMFGSRITNAINWAGHDPASLIENLRATSIHLWTATGLDGPYDPQPNPGATGIEALTHGSTLRFHDHLVEADVPSDYHDYTYGTHTWAYWTRDLQEYVGEMMTDFAHPKTPTSVTYTSVDKKWSQWGWSLSFDRPSSQAWSTLAYAGPRGFTLTGSGTATVVTPPSYRAGSRVVATIAGKTSTLRAARDGRLHVVVPLGSTETTVVVQLAPRSGG